MMDPWHHDKEPSAQVPPAILAGARDDSPTPDGETRRRPVGASATLVNRTHRIVHARALGMQMRRQTVRGLWLPLAISCTLLAVAVFAVWSVLDEYEVAPQGLPDSGQQMLVLIFWCLPVTLAVLAVIWFRRKGAPLDGGSL